MEKLRINGVDKNFYYPLWVFKVYLRQGLVQPLKRILPDKLINAIMKSRRK